MDSELKASLIEMTAQIATAYVAANRVDSNELAQLIVAIYGTLRDLPDLNGSAPAVAPVPAYPIRRSVTPEFIYCLEDGLPFKSLKRHLKSHYNMTPEEYRAKWGLPKDYPMVSPNYAAKRSRLAQLTGLGRQRRRKD